MFDTKNPEADKEKQVQDAQRGELDPVFSLRSNLDNSTPTGVK